MSLIRQIRQLTGLTQLQLSEYLNISRSTISMAERGYRDLPAEVSLKASHILIQLLEEEKKKRKEKQPEQSVAKEQLLKQAAVHADKIAEFNFKKMLLSRRLKKMQKAFLHAASRRSFINISGKGIKGIKKNKGDNQWEEYHSYVNNKKMEKIGPLAQLKLQVKIEELSGYAAVQQAIVKKFFG